MFEAWPIDVRISSTGRGFCNATPESHLSTGTYTKLRMALEQSRSRGFLLICQSAELMHAQGLNEQVLLGDVEVGLASTAFVHGDGPSHSKQFSQIEVACCTPTPPEFPFHDSMIPWGCCRHDPPFSLLYSYLARRGNSHCATYLTEYRP